MGTNTENHQFYQPDNAELDWGDETNDNWAALDVRLILKGTEDERPDPGTADRWYLATDTLTLYYDNGTDWEDILASVGDADTLDGEEGAYYADHDNMANVSPDDHHEKTQPIDIDSSNWGGREFVKDGGDGFGIVNFKTQ